MKNELTVFLSILEEVIQPKANRLVLMCVVGQFGACGGIGDRIRGIPYAVALAHISIPEFWNRRSVSTATDKSVRYSASYFPAPVLLLNGIHFTSRYSNKSMVPCIHVGVLLVMLSSIYLDPCKQPIFFPIH